MAGNIQNVNLQKLFQEVFDYGAHAVDYNSSLVSLGTKMNELQKVWSGKRINSLLTSWNSSINTINGSIKYFKETIYLILWEIYFQYVSMEAGSPTDQSPATGVNLLSKAPLTQDSVIKFENAKAKSIVNEINTYANNAIKQLKVLVTKLDSMQGYSDSLKTLAVTYKQNATNIQKTLNALCQKIADESQKAYNDVNITEGYNEKDAKRAATTSKN